MAQFCFEQGLIEQNFSVETQAGKMVPALILKNKEVVAVEVDMGIPQFDSQIMKEKKRSIINPFHLKMNLLN